MSILARAGGRIVYDDEGQGPLMVLVTGMGEVLDAGHYPQSQQPERLLHELARFIPDVAPLRTAGGRDA